MVDGVTGRLAVARAVTLPAYEFLILGNSHAPLISTDLYKDAQRTFTARVEKGEAGRRHVSAGTYLFRGLPPVRPVRPGHDRRRELPARRGDLPSL